MRRDTFLGERHVSRTRFRSSLPVSVFSLCPCPTCLHCCPEKNQGREDARARRGSQSARGRDWPLESHLCRLAPRCCAPAWEGPTRDFHKLVADHGSRCVILCVTCPRGSQDQGEGPSSRPTESPGGTRRVSCSQLQLPAPVNDPPWKHSQSSLSVTTPANLGPSPRETLSQNPQRGCSQVPDTQRPHEIVHLTCRRESDPRPRGAQANASDTATLARAAAPFPLSSAPKQPPSTCLDL